MGGPHVTCRFQKTAMSHVFVATIFPCPLSNLRNVHVACHYEFLALSCDQGPLSHVEFKKHQGLPVTRPPCRMSNLKKRPCCRVDFKGLGPYFG